MNDSQLSATGFNLLDAKNNPPGGAAGEPANPVLDEPAAQGRSLLDQSLGVYAADFPDPGAHRHDPALSAMAELAAHKDAETPMSMGLFGGHGAGKSSALARLVSGAVALSGAAEETGEASSFRPSLVAVRIEAGDGAAEPSAYIASQIYDALAKSAGEGAPFASLAREAMASLQDVHAVAREAADQLALSRQRLEAERRGLEETAGRRARLAETVLFQTPGARVDNYARAHRGKIESQLRAFGFDGDLIAIWKEFVRETAERNVAEKFGFCAQSLWSYRGQTRLLVLTLLFALVAWGLNQAEATRATWVGWMKVHGGSQIASLGLWIDAHAGLLSTLRGAAIFVAALCLVLDAWRATRFFNPIFRGASLLKIDLEARRRDLDALLAHQTRRVDLLAKEVEAHARRADEAERRADGPVAIASPAEEVMTFYGADEGEPEARARFARDFLDSLERLMTRAGQSAPRIVVAIDGFEHLSPQVAAAFAQTAGRMLARRGFVSVYAMDEKRLAAALGANARVVLSRLVQIPLQIGEDATDRAGDSVAGFLDKGRSATDSQWPTARTSAFDRPLADNEIALVRALAPLAGDGRRGAKRFVNLYRLVRASGPLEVEDAGALAVALFSNERGEAPDEATLARASQIMGQSVTQGSVEKAQAMVARFRV